MSFDGGTLVVLAVVAIAIMLFIAMISDGISF